MPPTQQEQSNKTPNWRESIVDAMNRGILLPIMPGVCSEPPSIGQISGRGSKLMPGAGQFARWSILRLHQSLGSPTGTELLTAPVRLRRALRQLIHWE